jgi:hypothetical protein
MEERKMKTRKLLISIMLLSAVSMLHAANTEEYWGTWVNREYDAYPSKPAMFILTPDGKFAEYGKESDAGPLFTGTITIKEKWTDSEGNIWYKVAFSPDFFAITVYRLMKLSNSGKTLEEIWSPSQVPTEIDPNSPNYGIRYRK